MKRTISLALLVVLALPALPAAGDTLSDYLGKGDALVLVSILDGGRFEKEFRDSPYGRILQGGTFDCFRDFLRGELGDPLGELDRDVRRATGLSLDEILGTGYTELSFAFLDVPASGEPGYAFVLGAPREFRDKVAAKLAEAWGADEPGPVVEGVEVWREQGRVLAIARRDDKMLVTNREPLAEGWVARKTVQAPLCGPASTRVAEFHLDLAGLATAAEGRDGEEAAPFAAVVRALGFDRVTSEFEFGPEGYVSRTRFDGAAPGRGLLGAIPREAPELEGAWTPKSALQYSVQRIDLAHVHRIVVDDLLPKIAPDAATVYREAMAKADVDLERDVLARLEGTLVTYVANPEMGGLFSDTVISARSGDSEAVASAFDRALGAIPGVRVFRDTEGPGAIRALRHDQTKGRRSEVEPSAAILPILGILGLPTAYAPSEGALVLGSSSHAIERHRLRRNSADTRAWSAEDLRPDGANSASGFAWNDTAKGLGATYNTLLPLVEAAYGFVTTALAGAKKKAEAKRCRANLSQIGMALMMYADQNPDRQLEFANPAFFEALARGDFGDAKVFACPSYPGDAAGGYQTWEGGRAVGAGIAQMPVAWDRVPCHGGRRNVLFVDGHVEKLGDEEFRACLADRAPKGARVPELAGPPAPVDPPVHTEPAFDPSLLPPAEAFAGEFAPGIVAITWETESTLTVTSRGYLGLTSGTWVLGPVVLGGAAVLRAEAGLEEVERVFEFERAREQSAAPSVDPARVAAPGHFRIERGDRIFEGGGELSLEDFLARARIWRDRDMPVHLWFAPGGSTPEFRSQILEELDRDGIARVIHEQE